MENMELENSMTDIAPAAGYTGNGVPYYDNLMQSEQMEVTEIIRLRGARPLYWNTNMTSALEDSSTTETTGYAANTWNL